HGWIDLYASDDFGATWQYLNRPVTFRQPGNSNPPSLVQLPNGKISLVYGNRDMPCTVCAVVSQDEGKTWSEPTVLRKTGGSGDMGYTRAVVLEDGTVVTAYYLNEDNAGERFIEVTRWKP
ncbi:MAG: sialidase family protein, partial [Anaerolineae bacterium]|nr:sialidase family protein [Anaerolineae bacterium]